MFKILNIVNDLCMYVVFTYITQYFVEYTILWQSANTCFFPNFYSAFFNGDCEFMFINFGMLSIWMYNNIKAKKLCWF